jgi:hypothetical protein
MHERALKIAVANEVPENVHDLRVQDGGHFKVLASGGRASEDEDSGTDDGANPEGGQRPGAESLLQAVTWFLRVRNELVDRLTGKKLIRQRIAPDSRRAIRPWNCVWNLLSMDMIASKTATTYAKTTGAGGDR